MTDTLTETSTMDCDLLLDGRAEGLQQWQRVCRVNDLEEYWGEAALVDGVQVALFKLSASEIFAVDQRDPATSARVMARGIVGSKGSRPTIASPLHKQVYDLATGECYSNPDLWLQTYPLRVVDGWIEVSPGVEARAAA